MGNVIPLARKQPAAAAADDSALVERMGRGDTAALAQLYDRYHAQAYGFLRRIAGTTGPDLDDMVQNTFLEAYRSAARFSGSASVKTWLFAIAANTARNYVRSETRRRRAMQSLADAPRPARAPSPRLHTQTRQELQQVVDAIDQLSHAQKAAYVMCVIEEVPTEEAARALGVPKNTLWRRIHDARKALRQALQGGSDE